MNNALASVGWRFGNFKEDKDKQDPKPGRPPILVLCTDQESTQLAAVAFLRNGQHLWVEHVSDPAHRSHNDVHLALSAAGLLKFSLWCISLYNLRYGPWNKGTWSWKLKEVAETVSTSMAPSDPLLLEFFPSILEDAGRPESDNTELERQKWLKSVPDLSCVRTKGTKASTSRFNSLTLAHSKLDHEWSALAFLLSVVCISHGWAAKPADLWAPDKKVAISTAGPVAAGKQKAKEDAKKDMQEERRTAANTFHVMTKFICVQDNKDTARMVYLILRPEALRCSKMLKELRSDDMTLSYFSKWAHWWWMDTATEHLKCMSDLAGLQRVGFNMDVLHVAKTEESEVAWQDSLAGQMGRMLLHLLRVRAGSQLFHTNGFGATAGLVHLEDSCRAGSLKFFQAMYETVKAIHESGTLLAKTVLVAHFSQTPVMKYILQGLSSSMFKVAPDFLAEELRCIWSGLLNSKLIEDGNKIQREAEQRHSSSKDLGRMAGWFGLTNSGLLKSYGRSEVQPESLYHMTGDWNKNTLFSRKKQKTVARDVESAQPDSDDKFLEDITKTRTWPSHNHESEQDVLADFSLLKRIVAEKWDWSKLESSWHAALLPEGHAVIINGSSPALVLKAYRRAALCWPCSLTSLKDLPDILEPRTDISSLYWVHVFDSEVTILEIVTMSPLRYLVQTCKLASLLGLNATKSQTGSFYVVN